ncbi:MAG: CoA transferase [Dehalococcoidia bacterium]|nr:CoA transferase [Dehalococcoidia bacterium]
MSAPRMALEGIRVLDLGRFQAGPRAGLVMARLGAEVIKIESIGGEESRSGGGNVRGQSAYWVQYNSGKKSICLDLRKDSAKKVLRDLVEVSDVILQNFRPGTMDEMGFGYEALHAINKRIIMLNVSAYGQYGPYRDRIGFDPIGQAICGLMWLTGYPETPPTMTAMPVIDRITALHGTIGVLAALRERELSGEGQAIDVCLADTGFSLTEIPIAHYLGAGAIPRREGSRIPGSLTNVYKTKDGWTQIIIANQNIWERLCNLLGKSEWLTDPRLSGRSGKTKNAHIVEAELEKWFAARNTEDAVNTFSGAGIPCCPVNDIPQAAKCPQIWERELLVEVPDPVAGKIHVAGKYIKLSRSKEIVGSAPAPGQHTDEVLTGILKYSSEKVQKLREEKAVG